MADPEDGPMTGERITGEHIDEGVAHAWLDGQLPAPDAARLESHIAACAECAAVVATARGFVAASSRILTGLDGVPSRVVPRARPHTRIWQARAAAAIVILTVGAAAVLTDTGDWFGQLRREPAAPAAAPSVAPAIAPPAPSPAVAQAPAPDVKPPSLAAGKSRSSPAVVQPTAVGSAPRMAPRMEKKQQPVQDFAGAQQASADTVANAPVATAGSAVAAKAMAAASAPAAAPPAAMQMRSSDAGARANAASMMDARQRTFAAYRECAGKVVTLAALDSGVGGVPQAATVRLDSARRPSPASAFVVTAPGEAAPLEGWWRPAGADSAVVVLVSHHAAPAAASGAGSAAGSAASTSMTRVRCTSP